MKLTEALTILNQRKSCENELAIYLAAGFNPQSLSSFLAAQVAIRHEGFRIRLKTGAFGDLFGNIEKAKSSDADFIAICVEWDDLDPRLGVRQLTQITWKDAPEIIQSARGAMERSLQSILDLASGNRNVAVSLPSLPVPQLPCAYHGFVNDFEAQLHLIVAQMQASLSSARRIKIVKISAEIKMDLAAALHVGFPYSIDFSSKLGETLAEALMERRPKKGIVVDLDDTLWKGIVGEEGVDGVHWDLDHKAQHHGIFQQFLHSLSAEGTLVAVASKNTMELVQEAFASREDLLLPETSVFPIEAHWSPKSESISRILKAWNIAADSVVFIDDNPLELAEVGNAHPGIVCRAFPCRSPNLLPELLQELRDLFAKDQIGVEDAVRAQSLRLQPFEVSSEVGKANVEDLLASLNSEMVLEISADPNDERALELINKTNQFNLNGVRIPAAIWRRSLTQPQAFLMTVSYRDKFGTLGKIGVVKGRRGMSRVHIESWVLSCRAFARRIEHACIDQLFRYFEADVLCLDYRKTDRNSPVAEFLTSFGIEGSSDSLTLTRQCFYKKVPPLHHNVKIFSTTPEVNHV